ncbi:prolyl-tRNA synthetase [Aaosphaeria arxii CBS 175.79]|uniref:proline--tRNA ligase n=1 Tax=Aaosphaeria arxii CBS 175.79 TaxID=1450172 RepID=A0A6A5Y188_9PLEO|nr:prolyl-tRNA synthetase [Aaosphaeria arxii CBS 175.79]KAF2018837.1 prolyl-tRNA synthetase [Aaosphaeria arxii CBS 175.79]
MAVRGWNNVRCIQTSTRGFYNTRTLTTDSRNRLSKFWAPTGGISTQDGEDDSQALLIKGGFIRQAHSGVYHILPLGLRVQNKLESLIDKHMTSIGASKLLLSFISTEELWRKSGRYSANSELLRVQDRRDSGFLLSPTHEEEITSLVANVVHSYKDLPLRLYQIGRKYRDERRPRGGLLRSKEFLMKDLYTFDYSAEHGLKTYEAVRMAYANLFNELKVPYLVAEADSGNMGGKLSHEYHFISPRGEDNVWSCNSCSYVANEELAEKKIEEAGSSKSEPLVFTGISSDRTTKVTIKIPRPDDLSSASQPTWSEISSFVNLHTIKNAGIDIDTGIETAALDALLPKTTETVSIQDYRLPQDPTESPSTPSTPLDLTIIRPGDSCPRCDSGALSVQKAIEVGHTFHLGTRYSAPLNAMVTVHPNPQPVPIEMGCHGIGVSRLIGAMASLMSDSKGLNWPRAVAPFEVAIVYTSRSNVVEEELTEVYDVLSRNEGEGNSGVDVVLDDRSIKSLSWKLNDADLIGYPIIVVFGKAWAETKQVELQCRRLGVKKNVDVAELRKSVTELLEQL